MGTNVAAGISGRALAVTPSDTGEQDFLYLYIGTAGDVAVTTARGDVVTYKNAPSGGYLWIKTSKVMATNTTAISSCKARFPMAAEPIS